MGMFVAWLDAATRALENRSRELVTQLGRPLSPQEQETLALGWLQEQLSAGRPDARDPSETNNAILAATAFQRGRDGWPRKQGKRPPCKKPKPRGLKCRRCGYLLSEHRQPAPRRGYFDGD